MAIKIYKPTSPGRRFQTSIDRSGLSKDGPQKSLTSPKPRSGGRNNRGRITTRFRGGGHKRRFRLVDFKRHDKSDIPAKVATIEYDPNRSAHIALLNYVDGEKRYILAPNGMAVGDTITAGENVDIRPGNALPIYSIPLGTQIHNIEMKIGKGGQLARSAGSYAQLMAKEGSYCLLRLPSGELRRVHRRCWATIGTVGNSDHENVKIGKAGRSRWLGRRPHNRGVAMNPIDHPHGGGEGKTNGGRHPVTPWGKPTKGAKTRKNKRTSVFIVKKRR